MGDVPIEASYHGSLLLYRLLQRYPSHRLQVIELGPVSSHPERRLSKVPYRVLSAPLARLQKTRFARPYEVFRMRSAATLGAALAPGLRRQGVQAILSVTHGAGWISAAAVAKALRVPLHLVCHDEWALLGIDEGDRAGWNSKTFESIYRQASSRFCVSPYMAEDFQRRFGVEGTVLYPNRAFGVKAPPVPPARLTDPRGSLVGAFAGSINSNGYVDALKWLAKGLAALGGKLIIYGPMTAKEGARVGLDYSNLSFMGLVSPDQLLEELRLRADFLFTPMSFERSDRRNMELSFPSKLTDYTLTGLPLLIYGPDYCSAVRWALQNGDVAEVLTCENRDMLNDVLARLSNVERRRTLGESAVALGEKLFSYEWAETTFLAGLLTDDQPIRDNNAA